MDSGADVSLVPIEAVKQSDYTGHTCQMQSKIKPKPNPMKEREILTVPSERVAIDIVGPFPKAKGGFQYLLTCIDIATRWPEAIPVKSVTANFHCQTTQTDVC